MTEGLDQRKSSGASVLESFGRVSVLVVGDVMLDEYVLGEVERISPEAPVPVVDFRTRRQVVGGAANAAANIISLTGKASLGGVVGQDPEADALSRELAKLGIDAQLVTDNSRPTTMKTRLIGGTQQMLRVDRELRAPVSSQMETSLLVWAAKCLPSTNCVLISDYGKGVVTDRTSRELIGMATAQNKPVVVDPKGRDYSRYDGATVVTPNAMELRSAAEPLTLSSRGLQEDVTALRSVIHDTALLVTRGSEGVTLFQSQRAALHIPARRRSVFDVTGAGDTFVAALALAIGAGASLAAAMIVANEAAGIVVGKVGTGTVDLDELRTSLVPLRADPASSPDPDLLT
jgi:D-beta-D-heptose 7-phosphate kinase/D-beta-D-heptose 1-phosphate adenosyltransferase